MSKAKRALYFDIETIPSKTANQEVLTELTGIQPNIPETPAAAMPAARAVAGQTIDTIMQAIGMNPPAEYLEKLLEHELAGKARKSLVAAIEEKIKQKGSTSDYTPGECLLLSTTPEYCEIVAIGLGAPAKSGDSLLVDAICQPKNSEEYMLKKFWEYAKDADPLVCFNGLNFDIPVILTRSAILGIESTREIDTSPYRDEVCDIYLKRFGVRGKSDKKRPGRQVDLARCYGIPVKDHLQGADVYHWWLSGEHERIREHVEDDISVLYQLYRKMRGYFL